MDGNFECQRSHEQNSGRIENLSINRLRARRFAHRGQHRVVHRRFGSGSGVLRPFIGSSTSAIARKRAGVQVISRADRGVRLLSSISGGRAK
eukprot:11222632-Lingulodinium_polyedra.AAC.1